MTSTERDLRDTIAALLRATGERHADLADALGIVRSQVSRKQAGTRPWSLKDLHHLAAHYGMGPADLLCGMDHAVRRLPEHRRADTIGGTRTTLPAAEETR
ncbi:helix-turn-helix domain-containing protein [Streptomyces sp. ACA25]|uniref:helix-turn-helix domain-containing protein n=1 Tax=Streptomyces sp. ACA25 TaxID=3022596 RepID=UPI0023081523|nr:helix-turn-helix domain-containing protein [Streptomyces sp. ACA25]MDB1090443.1 helix-turn-helix domain-containing protein [Streptomyces sp. ACA25]